jgi:hypothetical protein
LFDSLGIPHEIYFDTIEMLNHPDIVRKIEIAKDGGDVDKINGMIDMIPKAQIRITRDPLTLA